MQTKMVDGIIFYIPSTVGTFTTRKEMSELRWLIRITNFNGFIHAMGLGFR